MKMKMKQLKEKLNESGFDVSERMVKYYIEIGLLPPAEHLHTNQAQYEDIHLLRLCKISALKNEGYGFSEIKRAISSDNKLAEEYAQNSGISLDAALMSYEVYAREESDYLFNYLDKSIVLNKEALISYVSCDKMIFDLAVDTGALENKESYGYNDILILTSIRNLFKVESENGKSEIIEKISEMSKINNLATQYVHLFESAPKRRWLYERLFESITNGKIEQLCKDMN